MAEEEIAARLGESMAAEAAETIARGIEAEGKAAMENALNLSGEEMLTIAEEEGLVVDKITGEASNAAEAGEGFGKAANNVVQSEMQITVEKEGLGGLEKYTADMAPETEKMLDTLTENLGSDATKAAKDGYVAKMKQYVKDAGKSFAEWSTPKLKLLGFGAGAFGVYMLATGKSASEAVKDIMALPTEAAKYAAGVAGAAAKAFLDSTGISKFFKDFWWIFLIGGIVIIAIGLGIYFWKKHQQKKALTEGIQNAARTLTKSNFHSKYTLDSPMTKSNFHPKYALDSPMGSEASSSLYSPSPSEIASLFGEVDH